MHNFLLAHLSVLGEKLVQHIYIATSATFIAILVGVPLGIWINQYKKIRHIILSIISIFQTIPSLALLAFLIPFLGIGLKPTLVTLTLYALLPITRNTFVGLQSVKPDLIEAANGLGFARWQRLRLVTLPLAMPMIVAGIRTATAMTVGITTIAAFIGAGGLGDFITQGLALDSTPLILLGAIPTALLALALDYIIVHLQILSNQRQRHALIYKKFRITILVTLIAILLGSVINECVKPWLHHQNSIKIASKNFTEQYILGNIMADMIQAHSTLNVKKIFNLGSTAIVQNALLKKEVDLYPEYTGTAYQIILKHHAILNAKTTYHFVKQQYQQRYHLIWLKPFGFSNSQTLAITKKFALQHHIKTLSDLARLSSKLTVAAPAEFIKRADALPGLKKVYHFKFRKILQMEPDLLYKAIKNHDTDVIEVFTTDARIQSYHLLALKDDKHMYPPYYAAPVVRSTILIRYPQIKTILNQLAGKISDKDMQKMNYAVDIAHQTPQQVAHSFLKKHHLL